VHDVGQDVAALPVQAQREFRRWPLKEVDRAFPAAVVEVRLAVIRDHHRPEDGQDEEEDQPQEAQEPGLVADQGVAGRADGPPQAGQAADDHRAERFLEVHFLQGGARQERIVPVGIGVGHDDGHGQEDHRQAAQHVAGEPAEQTGQKAEDAGARRPVAEGDDQRHEAAQRADDQAGGTGKALQVHAHCSFPTRTRGSRAP